MTRVDQVLATFSMTAGTGSYGGAFTAFTGFLAPAVIGNGATGKFTVAAVTSTTDLTRTGTWEEFEGVYSTTGSGSITRVRLIASSTGSFINWTNPTTCSIEGAAYSEDLSVPVIHLRDEKTSGTAGGTSTNGSWLTRVLNTEAQDTGGNCTLASNQFALAAGTYEVMARSNARSANSHQARIQNITDATTTLTGSTARATSGLSTDSWVIGRFTITATKTFELQYQVETGVATSGLGLAGGFGTEVYAEVWLRKVG